MLHIQILNNRKINYLFNAQKRYENIKHPDHDRSESTSDINIHMYVLKIKFKNTITRFIITKRKLDFSISYT